MAVNILLRLWEMQQDAFISTSFVFRFINFGTLLFSLWLILFFYHN